MAVQVIINQQKGPLPVNATFNAPSDAPIFLEVAGSVWTQTANAMIGIAIALDGQIIGTAQIFSNANATHRAVVPAYLPIQLKQGQHTLTLSPVSGSSTVSDVNDFFTAVLHY
jgi:hypothetical protein